EQRLVRLADRRVDGADITRRLVHLADAALEADGAVAVVRMRHLLLPPAEGRACGSLDHLLHEPGRPLPDPCLLQGRRHLSCPACRSAAELPGGSCRAPGQSAPTSRTTSESADSVPPSSGICAMC